MTTRLFIFVASLSLALALPAGAAGGFDQYGYNYGARNFVGPADGVDRVLDGAVWGDPAYANDHLKMKWTAEWDRGNAEGWTDPAGYEGAWTDNQWNGQVPDGSGETWHYKIKWSAECAGGIFPEIASTEDEPVCIWGQFELVMSHGTVANDHFWDVHAIPSGYGVN